MSREIIRIEFILASLKKLEIFAYDIGNAQLHSKCREKLWKEGGTKFGTKKVMLMIIARALYGINRSGAVWRENLAESLRSLG